MKRRWVFEHVFPISELRPTARIAREFSLGKGQNAVPSPVMDRGPGSGAPESSGDLGMGADVKLGFRLTPASSM